MARRRSCSGLRPNGRHAIGLDLGASKFSGALVDLRGGVVKSAQVELDGRNGADAVEVVFGLIDSLIRRNGRDSVLGVGIGAPGLVDSRSGVVRWAVNLDWSDLPLGSMVAERYGMPVVVANDSQAAAVAESTYGNVSVAAEPGRRPRRAGYRCRHHPRRPAVPGRWLGRRRDRPLHLWPVPRRRTAELCRCGRYGCLETVASMAAMVSAARQRRRDGHRRAGAHRRVPRGSEQVREVVLRAARMLGEGIAAMIAALNVNHVLIIGPATHLGADYLDAGAPTGADERVAAALATDDTSSSARRAATTSSSAPRRMLMTQELGLSLAR